jgi:hypothetical protein
MNETAQPTAVLERTLTVMRESHARMRELDLVYFARTALDRAEALAIIVRMVGRADITDEERTAVRVLRQRFNISKPLVCWEWRSVTGSPAGDMPPGL